MLDQNTDRMWYVIGAVIIGAAIIFIMNNTFPQLFASIGETFSDKVENIGSIPITELEQYEDKQSSLINVSNLLVASKPEIPLVSSDYLVTKMLLRKAPVVGETYTLTVKGSNAYVLRPHNSGPVPVLGVMSDIGGGYYVATFKWREYNSEYTTETSHVWLYNGQSYNDVAKEPVTIEWMTLVQGDVPLLTYK